MVKGIFAGAALTAREETGKCTKPSAAIAERTVKFLLGQPVINPFIAVNVLKKTAAGPIREDLKIGVQEGLILKATLGPKITHNLRH